MDSSLIAGINSSLHHLTSLSINKPAMVSELKIGLRNLKVLLVCLTKVRGDYARFMKSSTSFGALASFVCIRKLESMGLTSLLSRTQEVTQKILLLIELSSYELRSIDHEIHGLAKEADDEWKNHMNQPIRPLTVDEVVCFLDSSLDSTVDFLVFVRGIMSHKILSIDRELVCVFEVHISFLKNVLLFAMQTGATRKQMQKLLIHIQPFAMDAACIFVKDDPSMFRDKWIEQVQSKCSMVNCMATDSQVYQAYAQALSTSRFTTRASREMDGGDTLSTWKNFLDSLISLLWNVLRHSDPKSGQLKVLYESLRFSRSSLKQLPQNFVHKKTRNRIAAMLCDVGVVICSIHQPGVEISNLGVLANLLQRLDTFQAEIEISVPKTSNSSNANELGLGVSDSTSFMEDIEMSKGTEKDPRLQKRGALSSHQLPQIVGFQDEELTSILDGLTRGSKLLQIVAISGMAGLGKTTLALKVFSHPSVTHHFQARAWCPVSQVLDKRGVLVQLLHQIHPGSYLEMPEEDLANKLRQCLKGKRYLIFLDDVWTNESWNCLSQSFPDDSTESRIILTSRNCDIAPHGLLIGGKPHLLRLRKVKECLEILQAKLFPANDWPRELDKLGMQLAEKCKGLPLTAVIVAGFLATTQQKDWMRIVDTLSSGGPSGAEQCNNALELSYKHLPDYLKQCLLYFGAFPEDEKLSATRLIQLWIAEGFVKRQDFKRTEDVARGYLDNLIQRSLVIITKTRSIGGVKTCMIHDLVHEFCVTKAKQESLFHLLQGSDQLSDFNESCNLQRLSIHSHPLHFKESGLFCPRAHTLLFSSTGSFSYDRWFDMLFIVQIFKLLRVLDIDQISLLTGIPSEIELLILLRYLSILSSVTVIPPSIGNLSNLETFIANFRSSRPISFPHTLWNLQKLRYLHVSCLRAGFSLPFEKIENTFGLLELETLSGVVFFIDDGSIEKQMRKFPNIRKLKCSILPGEESAEELNSLVVVPHYLCHLESLTISEKGKFKCELGSAENLRKVTLKGFELSREEIANLGNMPSLEVLKLLNILFTDGSLEMEEGEFSKLKFLHLDDYGNTLERWTASDDELPSLQKLVFHYCRRLKEIPSSLETNPMLEEIEAYRCSSTLENLVRDIEEVQKDFGNSVKVDISS